MLPRSQRSRVHAEAETDFSLLEKPQLRRPEPAKPAPKPQQSQRQGEHNAERVDLSTPFLHSCVQLLPLPDPLAVQQGPTTSEAGDRTALVAVVSSASPISSGTANRTGKRSVDAARMGGTSRSARTPATKTGLSRPRSLPVATKRTRTTQSEVRRFISPAVLQAYFWHHPLLQRPAKLLKFAKAPT